MVVTAPVVGKLSRQSFEQIVGTLIGGVLGYATWLAIDACGINRDAFVLSACLSICSAAMGFFNVVIEESLSDANMTAVTYLSVVFGTAESSTGTLTSLQDAVAMALTPSTLVKASITAKTRLGSNDAACLPPELPVLLPQGLQVADYQGHEGPQQRCLSACRAAAASGDKSHRHHWRCPAVPLAVGSPVAKERQ